MILVSCSDKERNCIQGHGTSGTQGTACKLKKNRFKAHETTCKLRELDASSWTWNILHAFWNILHPFWIILHAFSNILYSFWNILQSFWNILEHSGTFWNILFAVWNILEHSAVALNAVRR